jgi:hypothetical protein
MPVVSSGMPIELRAPFVNHLPHTQVARRSPKTPAPQCCYTKRGLWEKNKSGISASGPFAEG